MHIYVMIFIWTNSNTSNTIILIIRVDPVIERDSR